MNQRLCGREQEFGLVIIPPKGEGFLCTEKKTEIVREIITAVSKVTPGIQGISAGVSYIGFWLVNGSRVYEDQGFLEFATAECLAGSYDLIAQEKAQELILNRALRRLQKEKYKNYKIMLFKNNVALNDPFEPATNPIAPPGFQEILGRVPYYLGLKKDQSSQGPEPKINLAAEVTYGSHHNYSYLARKQRRVFGILQSFLPIALPLSGNGHILKIRKNKCVYGFSQRAPHIAWLENELANNEGIDNSRSLINTRDESHMSSNSGFKRLHIICRDATRCEFQTWLVDGTTHLVLRLAEEGWRMPKRLRLKDPLKTLQELNRQIDLNYKVETEAGPVGVIKCNEIFLSAARRLKKLSPMEKKIIDEWAKVLKALKDGKWHKLVGKLDWATKWFLLRVKMNKCGFGLNSVRAWKICFDYHNISSSPRRSWFARLDKSGHIKHLIDLQRVKNSVLNPPETRAKTRSRFIKFCVKNPKILDKLFDTNWSFAKLVGRKKILFGGHFSPFSVASRSLEEFCRRA